MNINERVQQAQRYLRGEQIHLEEIRECADELYNERRFSYARRLFARLHREYPGDDKILQRWAVTTYKDDDQPGETRFDEAANILFRRFGSDPDKMQNSRAVGNLGSIFKQKWRFDNQESWLKTSLRYFNRGYELWRDDWEHEATGTENGPKKVVKTGPNFDDQGYCAVNTAYVCDTLAARQLEVGQGDPTLNVLSDELRKRAAEIRQSIVDYCEGTEEMFLLDWKAKQQKPSFWFYATWAEALMGMGKDGCAKAVAKMEEAIKHSEENSWHRDSTAQQIANWMEEDHFRGDKDYRKQAQILLEKVAGSRTYGSRNQRLGLALSGGGFRASIFHIGVLARLAEQDLLRDVEVISCVSGGSIIGAYYYLKVRRLLQTKPDSKIEQADYIRIVQDIETEFLTDINTDLRSNLFRDFGDNLRMALYPNYSRSSRIADLYEKRLYAKQLDKVAEAKEVEERKKAKAAKEAEKAKTEGQEAPQQKPAAPKKEGPIDPRIYMTDLLIRPMGENGDLMNVSPKRVNWKRRNKLPMLVLNATTLNTGHCWQFTATWMGEPPGYINSETDALPTLRRMYYEDEAPAPHNKVRLATAVGASSCVPGLFKPVQLRGLYQPDCGKLIDVELVDGGVYDNQGINTLIEQECNAIIISDSSGQLASIDDPGSGIIGVAGRTNAILQERVRACQLSDLSARYNSRLIKGYLLMHLTKGLPSEVVNWRLCDDPYEPNIRTDDPEGSAVLTPYGIRKNIQTALARIRTDLDSFHEQEAYTLMLSGYLMTDFEIEKGEGWGKAQSGKSASAKAYPDKTPAARPWAFDGIREQHEDAAESAKLQRLLDASADRVKVHRVSSRVRWLRNAVMLLLVGYFTWALFARLGWTAILMGIGALVVLFIFYRVVVQRWRFNPLQAVPGFLLGILLSPLTILLAGVLNAEYLRAGRVKRKTE